MTNVLIKETVRRQTHRGEGNWKTEKRSPKPRNADTLRSWQRQGKIGPYGENIAVPIP